MEAGVQHQVAMERYVNSYLTLHLLRVSSLILYGLAQAKSHLFKFPYLYHSHLNLICLICICHHVLSCPFICSQEELRRDIQEALPQANPCQVTQEHLPLTLQCLDMEVGVPPTLRALPYL